MLQFIIWLVAIEMLGLAAFPLVAAALPRLADRGYGLAKVAGLLLVTYVNYLAGGFGAGNNPWLLIGAMVVICGIGLAALGLRRDRLTQARQWLVAQRTTLLAEEVLFIALFVAWALVRAAHPAILSTEKPMDLALMTATHKATSFPPYDPWLSGTTINYYYGGYLAIGTLVTLTGVLPAVGYNLGLALLFGLVGTAAFSVAYNMTRSLRWAVLGPVFVLLVGNLDGLGQFLQHGASGFAFFNSSRIVEPTNCQGGSCTITEFPAFSFLLGDLHPHVIALPFTILCIGIALNLAVAARGGWTALAPTTFRRVLTLALAGVSAGALYFMNSWDWPTYLLLIGAALLVPALPTLAQRPLGEAVALAVGVLALSYVLYISFHLNFKPQYSSFGLRAHGSPTGQVLTMFGLFLLPVAAYIVTLFGERARATATAPAAAPQRAVAATAPTVPTTTSGRRGATAVLEREPADMDDDGEGDDGEGDDDLPRLPLPSLPRFGSAGGAAIALIVAALLAWVVFGLGHLGTIGLLLPFFGVALYLAWHEARAGRAVPAFALLLGAFGIGLIVVCDLLYLKDNFCGPDATGACAGDLYRMNTVFKFYYQAWTVLALGAAYGLYALAGRLRQGWQRFVAPGAGVAIAAAGGIYLLLGIFTPTTNPYTVPVANAAPTLDGSAYLSSYSGQPITITNAIPADAAAIKWLRANVAGHPTILEADYVAGPPGSQPGPQDYWPYPGDPHQELMMSRIATFTGLPTVLGWGYSHEGLWHSDAVVAARFADIQTMYTSADPAAVGRLLRQYDVRYVYVGGNERYSYYGGSQERMQTAIDRFKRFGTVVYHAQGVTILRIK